MRRYNGLIPDYADVMTVEEWKDNVDGGLFVPDDGEGYWCKGNKESRDSVWESKAEDATHVAWYNK